MNLNDEFSLRIVAHAIDAVWTPSRLPGVERRMLDRVGGELARATSVVRYAPGSRLPRHVHGGGDEVLVLEGVFNDEGDAYGAGFWLRSPRWSWSWSRHTPFTGAEGALFPVKVDHPGAAWASGPLDRATAAGAEMHKDRQP